MRILFCLSLLFASTAFSQRSDFSTIDFRTADSIALANKGESLKNLPLLTYNLTGSLKTDVEKFRAIYTWICTNIENDYSAYVRTRKKRKKLSDDREALLVWNHNVTPKVFQKLREEHKTACTGYAYLTREMASLAGLNSKIIDGYGRTATLALNENSLPNHSWNAIELNEKWYLCDPTWSAGRILIEEGLPHFESDYHDGYFLADPKLFVKNHYPLQKDWTLLEEPPTYTQFIEGPIVYKESFSPEILIVSPALMRIEKVKYEDTVFKLVLPKGLSTERISLSIDNGSSNKTFQPEILLVQNICSFKYSFDKTGTYDVHVKVNDAIIATYVIRVRRN